MNIEVNRLPPLQKTDRIVASEAIKSEDREGSWAESRSFSDEDQKNGQEEDQKNLDQRIQKIEKRLVTLNLKMTASGLNVRYTYSVSDKQIIITVRDTLTGEAIRRISEKELDNVEIRLAEMSGLLVDYNL